MSNLVSPIDAVADLRHAFDQTFAAPPPEGVIELESLLGIQIAGDPYGISIHEITGLVPSGRIVPLPGRTPGLLGLVGIQGRVLPVYSLALLLGYPHPGESSPWLVLYGSDSPLALAFNQFEGYLRVPRQELYPPPPTEAKRTHVSAVARVGTSVRPVVSIASVVATLKAEAGLAGAPKE